MISFEKNTPWLWILGIGLLIGLISSCGTRLKEDRTISGVVFNGTTMAPLPGSQVSLLQENGKGFPSSETEFQQSFSDTLGRYSLVFSPFKTNKATDIRLEASVGSVYTLSSGTASSIYPIAVENISLEDVLDGNIQIDLVGKPYGKLTLSVYNDTPVNLIDQAFIRVEGDDFDFRILLVNEELNDDYTFFVKGDDLVRLSWTVTKGGQENNFSDTISSKVNQEVVYRMSI